MPKFPVVKTTDLIKFFEARGFKKDRQTGSHIILSKPEVNRPVVIPNNKESREEIIRSNLKTAKISRDDFIATIKKSKKPTS